MSLASFATSGELTWLGVGNVEGTLVRSGGGTDSILLFGGVVGYTLPPLRPSITTVEAGDTLVLATDGIRSGFLQGLDTEVAPQSLADRILADHGKQSDDALVLVACYVG
jgi:phosphoserine phosphatase RsbX